MSWVLEKLYGLDPHNVAPSKDTGFSNPDWSAGSSGDTVGGIGNTTGMGGNINWTAPVRQTAQPTSSLVQQYGYEVDPDLQESNILRTHRGDYQAVWHPNTGTWSLQTVPGSGGVNVIDDENKFYNLSHGDLHVGINPYTGEMWYQRATNLGDLESGFGPSGMMAGTNFTGENGNGGTTQPSEPDAPTTGGVSEDQPDTSTAVSKQQMISNSGGGSFSAMDPSGLSYEAAQVPSMPSSQKVDYVKMLNSMLAADVFGGMMTGRKV